MKALAEVTKDALELPAPQRLTLARILIDLAEADAPVDPEAQAEWESELCRRLRAVQAGTARSRSFEDVFADLDRRFTQ
jgi:hypothetical protein